MPTQPELLAAGEALVKFFDTMKGNGHLLPHPEQQALLSSAQRHLILLEKASVAYAPKHHLTVHLAKRSRWMGNPRAHSTFWDESLNIKLRDVAQAAHPMKLHYRVHFLVQLQGQVVANSPFHG